MNRIKLTHPLRFAYGGTRIADLPAGHELVEGDEAYEYALQLDVAKPVAATKKDKGKAGDADQGDQADKVEQ